MQNVIEKGNQKAGAIMGMHRQKQDSAVEFPQPCATRPDEFDRKEEDNKEGKKKKQTKEALSKKE